MAVLIGLSFASPVFADTYAWDSFTGYATGGAALPVFQKPGTACATQNPFGPGQGPYARSSFNWTNTDLDVTVYSMDFWPLLSAGNQLISSASSVETLITVTDMTNLEAKAYYGDVHGGTNYNTKTRFSPIAPEIFGYQKLIAGRLYQFDIERSPSVPWYTSSTNYIYTDYLHIQDTNTTSNVVTREWTSSYSDDFQTTECAGSPEEQDHSIYGTVKFGINGITQANGSNPVPVPSSTYDGTFSGAGGSIGFGTTTANLADGIYSAKFQSMFGAATGTFPLCLVAPWISFLDVFQGFTQLPQSGGSIVVSQPFGSGTSTFSLASASGTFAAIGLVGITNLLFPFLEGLAWLTFGVVVFKKTFMKESDDDDNL